ncbi:acetyl-CoA synthetase-like protein [Cucurbitaria berberidis CBS 394.84]|uniref:Acetyl-CoA synthetase-like protein n=1 Tax=Cucurbitaria berberidis CBS 394.84 TaxID=1168544 RepID=A0A9P4L7F0_9PLEO|nr:acetyl-CoA synthetase-like protein [Cucurbitaria berberidis CBS 394.84]KAF1844971.1 acetyl-CoA synthetase-like protein [Cucurbitaria berberidis CBS 394.84]
MTRQRIYRSTYPPPQCPTSISLPQFLTQYNPDAASQHAWRLRERYRLGAGDVVGISAPSSVAHVQLIHAVLWTGATVALMNFLSTPDDFIHYFTVCKPKLLEIGPNLYGIFVEALAEVPSLGQIDGISLLGSHLGLVKVSRDLARPFLLRLNSAQYPLDFSCKKSLSVFDLSFSDSREHTPAICFSSGTSGKPKGVELSHHNLISSLAGIRSTDPAFNNSDSRSIFFAPLCHIYGLNTVGLMGVWLGSYTMLMKKYSLDKLLELASTYEANTLRIVPSIALAMTKTAKLDVYDLTSIKFIMCSGAALQPEVIQVLYKRFNHAPIFQGYGMTETDIATLWTHERNHIGSVGRLFANVEARIVDDDLNNVDDGHDGEMLVRGPTVLRLLIPTDRKKELIKYKGFQVAPSDLEGILTSHPFVDEGVVCARWDEKEGTEVPMAYVTLSNIVPKDPRGRHNAVMEIGRFLNGKVSPYKRLRGGVEILQEIPKTASGKILRRFLPARLTRAWSAKL